MSEQPIFVVEDEPDIARLVSQELQRYGHCVKCFSTGKALHEALRTTIPKLCVIDLGLPDMDGLELVRELTGRGQTGVIILTGRDSLPDRVLGLELGADDYVAKPFDPRELVARAHSVLRRMEKTRQPSTQQAPEGARAFFDHWCYDPATLTLTSSNDRCEELSAGEAELLMALLQTPRRILNREQLMCQRDEAFDRSIDVRMSRIRKKIEHDPKQPKIIKTVYGLGYMLTCSVDWKSS